ncbi:LysR substrate-binding domain-containing protein [Pseudomonas sp. M20]|jgi:DNA-binding transcriptional LysR family regulator|uniref:LysR substrate-binding domain-containing protein n=1 Tax=Pseudomonas sp. M20 TaxID=3379129 RepID=UPI0038681761
MTYSSDDILPPFEALQAALAAARTGSFTAAAEELEVTHATISRRVELAEKWFQCALFDRHARGVTITATGQIALVKVAHAFDQLKQARQLRPGGQTLPVVKLATTASFARFWLIPRLIELEGSPQDLRIELVTSALNASLSSGEVDLAIRYGRGQWNDGDEEALFDESLCPVASPDVIAMNEQPLSLIQDSALLHTGDSTLWRAWMSHHGKRLTSRPADRMLGDYAQAIEAARSGLGIALWNPAIHSLEAFNGQLIALNTLSCPSPLRFFLLSKPGPAHTPPMRVRSRLRRLLNLSQETKTTAN